MKEEDYDRKLVWNWLKLFIIFIIYSHGGMDRNTVYSIPDKDRG
jgi:hypothetical protein